MLLRSELCNFTLLLTQGLNICMLAFCNIPGLRNYNCSCTINRKKGFIKLIIGLDTSVVRQTDNYYSNINIKAS